MAIPDFQSIFLPLLELAGDGQNHRVSDTVDTLALRFSLTTDDMNEALAERHATEIPQPGQLGGHSPQEGRAVGVPEKGSHPNHGPWSQCSGRLSSEDRREIPQSVPGICRFQNL